MAILSFEALSPPAHCPPVPLRIAHPPQGFADLDAFSHLTTNAQVQLRVCKLFSDFQEGQIVEKLHGKL